MGTSHKTRNVLCQDAFRCWALDESLTIAVADGAGSATHSAQGATLVCDLLMHWQEFVEPSQITTQECVWRIFREAHIAVNRKADELGVRPRELACTVLFAHLKPTQAIFAQLGDGAIVIGDQDTYRTVFWPEPAEYANATDFITESDYESRIHVQTVDQRVSEVAVMTDGLQRLALDFANRSAHVRFFQPFFQRLKSATNVDELNEPYRAFLDSESVNSKTDDDKTLILAVRQP
jgi:hypothetical protein